MSWTVVDGGAKFTGNVEAHAVVRNDFAGVVTARYVRIHPVDWHDHISMRAGVHVLDPGQISCAAEETALAATAAAAAATADAPHCVTVRESYVKPTAFFSSKTAGGFDHPELNNKDDKPCWAAATRDQNQVSTRTLLPLLT